MDREPSGFGEQAINKIAKVAIARQLKQAADVDVEIKTDLSKLARGQLDSMAIAVHGLLMRQSLNAEEFYLQIGCITVKPLSAVRGKIKLVHPSEGTLRLVINEKDLTTALNSNELQDVMRSQCGLDAVQQRLTQPKRVKSVPIECSILDGTIAITINLARDNSETDQAVVLAATPAIVDEKNIVLRNARYVEGNEPSSEFTNALLTYIHELLSLRDFEQKGMFLQIQQLTADGGKLSLVASARIEQFPSS